MYIYLIEENVHLREYSGEIGLGNARFLDGFFDVIFAEWMNLDLSHICL